LSHPERQITRHDQRKEQIKEHIRQSLRGSRHYQEFERKMKEKGYQVIKGRGISFIDSRKVKVKGSELNFSLQTIEQIIQRQRLVQGNCVLESSQLENQASPFSQQNQLNPYYTKQPYNAVASLARDLTVSVDQANKFVDTNDHIPKEFVQKPKRKKRKRRSQHL